ncbi:hypothetical protein ACP70R_012393 [Stipagrostis hirtigluma subsp. patula]
MTPGFPRASPAAGDSNRQQARRPSPAAGDSNRQQARTDRSNRRRSQGRDISGPGAPDRPQQPPTPRPLAADTVTRLREINASSQTTRDLARRRLLLSSAVAAAACIQDEVISGHEHDLHQKIGLKV